MYFIKVLTSVLIVLLFLAVGWFWQTAEKSRATDIGFGLMELTYILSLISMWWA